MTPRHQIVDLNAENRDEDPWTLESTVPAAGDHNVSATHDYTMNESPL